MCGIAGLLHWGRIDGAEERVERMTDAIVHRGPDDSGRWGDRDIELGFRRLSILDLAGGAQPMRNADESIIVVFNGEIYNHVELRRELEATGHLFSSDHSDTEVLVHGYAEWADGIVARLNGMFAFAIWDTRGRRLLLARDRHGIKPLYVARPEPGVLLFCSEVRGLLASETFEVQADPAAVLEYFSLQNLWHGRTPFRGVELHPSATLTRIDRDGERRRIYWDYQFQRVSKLSSGDAAQCHREILLEVMGRQVAADVPVMSYLSGGIDSSAVTVAAHRLDHRVRAYSCIFDLTDVGVDRFVDEREYSRAVAAEYDLQRVEFEVSGDALTGCLDVTIDALEYPRMGMAYVNFLIAERVARDAKVVLSGMGGDEVHGGYLARYEAVPRVCASILANLRARIARLITRDRRQSTDPFSVYRQMLNFPVPEHRLADAFTPEFLAASRGFSARDLIDSEIRGAPADDPWDVVMYVDAKTYLHGLLVLEDKLSMIHSLETRVPLLDDRLVDFVLTLPWGQLARAGLGKRVFRDSVKPWVPDAVYAKPKMGFGPPDASWYRGPLRPWIEDRLSSSRLTARGVFRPQFVAAALREHFDGTANNLPLIWSLLSFDSWCTRFGFFGGDLRAAA